jgi:hypothetical protein
MTPRALAQKLAGLPAILPQTREFERALVNQGTRKSNGVWYRSQKEHWLGWLSGYDGPGAYGRENWARNAKFIYNHIVCPPMVLWLGEATGIAKSKITTAKHAALSAGPNLPSQCAAIRGVIPWDTIEAQFDILRASRRSTKVSLKRNQMKPTARKCARQANSLHG